MKAGNISIDLTLDDKQFTVQVKNAGSILRELRGHMQQTADSTQRLDSHFNSLGGRFRNFMLMAATARFALLDFRDVFLSLPMAVLKTSGEIERMKKLMEGLSSEIDEVRKKAEALSNTKFVFNMAQNAPFEVKALTDAFIKLKTAGLDPTDGKLKALVDSVARFGGNSDILKRASIAIQQMAGKGVISMEELRQQLGEAVPTAMQHMADGLGLSMAELADKIKKGSVQAAGALEKMFFRMEMANNGAAKEMMDTWTGMLAKLETQWELFKNNVGESGALDAAKGELKSLIDDFSKPLSAGAIEKLSSLIEGMVQAFATLKNIIVEYGGIIADVLIGLIATKLVSFVGSFETAGQKVWGLFKTQQMAARESLIAEVEAANNAKAVRELNLQQMISVKELEIKTLVESEQEKNAIRARELSSEAQHLEKLASLKMARVAKLREIEAAASASASGNIKTSNTLLASGGSRDDAAKYAALAREQQQVALTARATAVAVQTEARALETAAAAIDKKIVSTKTLSVATTDFQAALMKEIATLREELVALQQTEAAKAKLAATTGMGAAAMNLFDMAATKVWNSLKGFASSMVSMGIQMGLMVGAIELAIFAWNKLTEAMGGTGMAYERLMKLQDQVKRGMADDALVKKFKKEIEDAQAKLANLRSTGGNTAVDGVETQSDANRQARIADLENFIKKAGEKLQEAEEQVSRNTAKAYANHEKQKLEHELDAIRNRYRARDREIQNWEKEELAKAGNDTAKRAAVTEQKKQKFIELDAANLAEQKQRMQAFIAGQQKIMSDFKAGTAGTQADFDQAQKFVLDQQEAIEKMEQRFAKGAPGATPGLDKKKGAKMERDDPLDRLLDRLKGKAAALKVEVDALKQGYRDYESLQEQAKASVAGRMASGEFDTANKDKDGKITSTNFMGGRDKRNQDAVKALNELQGAEKELMDQVVEETVKTMQLEAAKKALNDANGRLAETMTARDSIAFEAVNGNLEKHSSAIVSLLKHQAALIAKNSHLSESDLKVLQSRNRVTLAFQAGADAASALVAAEKKLIDAQINAITTVQGKRDAEHNRNKDRINAEADAREEFLINGLAQEGLTVEQRNKLQEDLVRNQKARFAELDAEQKRHSEASKTELQKLADTWADLTENMNKASAGWASGFLDELHRAFETGTFNWRKFLAGMLSDINKMLLQKAFGKQITGMFDGLGDWVKKGLNAVVGGATPAAAGAAQQGIGAATGVGLKAGANAIGGGLDAEMAKLGETTSNLTSSMGGLATEGVSKMTGAALENVAQSVIEMTAEEAAMMALEMLAMAAIEAAFAMEAAAMAAMSTSGFANGGIMTPGGPMPLKAYANGGIANKPQLALFGEGSMNEAFVPLPDGRSIPVTLTGGAPANNVGSQQVIINIQVNEAEGSGSEKKSVSGQDMKGWMQMAQRIKSVVREEIGAQKRPGGLLYK